MLRPAPMSNVDSKSGQPAVPVLHAAAFVSLQRELPEIRDGACPPRWPGSEIVQTSTGFSETFRPRCSGPLWVLAVSSFASVLA